MTESKRASGSDMTKVDAHEITAEEYEEIPEITEEMFVRGEWKLNGKPIRRGRPPKAKEDLKLPTRLRLDPDVVAHFKATGPGWQTRINDALRKVAGL